MFKTDLNMLVLAGGSLNFTIARYAKIRRETDQDAIGKKLFCEGLHDCFDSYDYQTHPPVLNASLVSDENIRNQGNHN